MARIIISIIFLYQSALAFGQEYSLEKCLEIAIANHTEVQAAQINLKQAQNETLRAKSRLLPAFSSGLYQGGNFGRSIDRFTNDYIDQFYNTTYANVQFGMPIFAGFRNKYAINAAQMQVLAAEEALKASKNKIKREVIRSFMANLLAIEVAKISVKQADRTKSQMEIAQKKLVAGTVTKLDLMQLQSQLAVDELNALDAQSSQKTTLLALFQNMNQPFLENATLVFNEPENWESEMLTIQDILNSLPETAQYRHLMESNKMSIKAEQAAKWPSLNFGGDYGLFYASTNKDRSFGQQLNDTRNGSLNLSLRIPIGASLQAKPIIEAQKIQTFVLENDFNLLKNRLIGEIESAMLQQNIAVERFQKSKKVLSIAQEAAQFITTQYEVGMVSIESLLLAKNTQDRAEINLLQSKYRLYQEIKILKYFYTNN
jgi:outer membrane protein